MTVGPFARIADLHAQLAAAYRELAAGDPAKVAEVEAERVFTPESLAAFWGDPWTAASIRELCRSRKIPAKKLGPKLWIIPGRALAGAMEVSEEVQPSTPASVLTPLRPYRVKVRPVDKR